MKASVGLQLALRCSVDAISFSAHADFPQTSDFLDLVNPPHVVLVHGEAGEMMRLKRALEQRAKATDRVRNLYTPKVTQPVHIRHQPRHIAKVCCHLAKPYLHVLIGFHIQLVEGLRLLLYTCSEVSF